MIHFLVPPRGERCVGVGFAGWDSCLLRRHTVLAHPGDADLGVVCLLVTLRAYGRSVSAESVRPCAALGVRVAGD
jgi:hypothetical protein